MRIGLLMATVLVMLPLSAQAQEKKADVAANTMPLSSRGMMDFMKNGHVVIGATGEYIILSPGTGIVLCAVSHNNPMFSVGAGLGSSKEKPAKVADTLDVSRCYEMPK